ncbi:unnamed protein product [Trifolium pratense]|uniref:Uncharacterized protein n=1 Tax=Trifolium pratense TaxID=57577 RepID=A0ACB0L0W3_TRIPR|nr:unnamed protein product [Trifolium pratense]
MIGSLLYLTASRPDIMFAVGVCARYQSEPKMSHLTQVKRIFKYVNGTCGYGILYSHGNNSTLVGYCDADWAGSADDRKSTSGACFFLRSNLVSWFSKKQNSVSLSTTEAEYIAAGSSCSQLLWMGQMLKVTDVETNAATSDQHLDGETVPEIPEHVTVHGNENGQVMTDNKEEVSDEHTDVNSPSNEKICLNLKKFILVEWSLEVEDGLFMTGCVIDLSIIIQACSFGDDLLYGLIYFQTYINLLHLECGVCAKVIMLCLKFVDEFSSLNSAAYISDGKLMVVLGAKYAKLCCSLKMYPLLW